MTQPLFNITNTAILNSSIKNMDDLAKLYKEGLFSDKNLWDKYPLSDKIEGMGNEINSRLKNRMSQLDLGIFNVIEKGPGKNLNEDEEICLFSAFGEIDTTDKIIKTIVIDKFSLVSPTLFHNSVHHTSLGYYTIIKKVHNSCITISDGMLTNGSFINYIKLKNKGNKGFVLACGDEYSPFFALDRNSSKKLMPTFISYRIAPSKTQGFYYGGAVESLEKLENTEIYKRAETIFADKDTFIELQKKETKKSIMTEYPITLDNPCGIIFRLALPFSLGINKKSLVLEKDNDKIHFFGVEY